MASRPVIREGQARLALAAMMSIYFFSYIQRAAVPGTVFDDIQMDLRASAAVVAGLGSLFLGVYAGSQLFIGMAADRFGGRRTLLWGGLVMAAGALWFPSCRSIPELYTARLVTGFGSAFMYLSIVHEVELLFGPRRFPAVLGIVTFSGLAGGMASTLPFAALATAMGWREALFLVAGVTALVMLGYSLLMRRLPPAGHVPVRFSLGPVREVLFSRRNWPLLAGSMVNFGIYFVIQNIVGKKFLQDVAGLSVGRAAVFVLAMAAASAAGVFFSGFWLRLTRHRRRPLLLAFAAMLAGGVVLLAAAVALRAGPAVYLAAYLLMAFSMASSPIYSTVMKEMNRPDCVAQSVAGINTCTYLGVALLAALAGWILDRFGAASVLTAAGRLYPPAAYLALFACMSVLALAALAGLFKIPETGTSAGGPT